MFNSCLGQQHIIRFEIIDNLMSKSVSQPMFFVSVHGLLRITHHIKKISININAPMNPLSRSSFSKFH